MKLKRGVGDEYYENTLYKINSHRLNKIVFKTSTDKHNMNP